jgi:hypothetical protein
MSQSLNSLADGMWIFVLESATMGHSTVGTRSAFKFVTGVIGTHQTVKECRKWLEKCRDEVRPEQGKVPSTRNPVFPGFSRDSPFEAEIVADDSLCGVIRPADFRRIHEFDLHNDRVSKAVDLYLDQIERLKERGAEVIICTLPIELLALLKGVVLTVPEPDAMIEGDELDQAEPEQEMPEREWNFHDLLKARSMRYSTPLQLIRPSTGTVRISPKSQTGPDWRANSKTNR